MNPSLVQATLTSRPGSGFSPTVHATHVYRARTAVSSAACGCRRRLPSFIAPLLNLVPNGVHTSPAVDENR
jgi:hypothetical protein